MWVCILTRHPEFLTVDFHEKGEKHIAHYDTLEDLIDDLQYLEPDQEDAKYKVLALNLQSGECEDVSLHYPIHKLVPKGQPNAIPGPQPNPGPGYIPPSTAM